MSLVVSDAPARQRYEAHLDGALAGVLEYAVKGDRIALIHTEVDAATRGMGSAPDWPGSRSTTRVDASFGSSPPARSSGATSRGTRRTVTSSSA